MSVEEPETISLPRIGQVISERYVIESLIGGGGFGAVFRGRDRATERPVAIKWLLPKLARDMPAMKRFLAEAKVTARIEHPNVVSIFDVGRDGESGAPFIIMELLRGQSLRERLDVTERCPPQETIELLLPAIAGVHAAHQANVVHRDLKPDNIFLCEDMEGQRLPTKVVDFGISKLLETEDSPLNTAHITKTGMTIGTIRYMAPEQLNAPKEVDVRFDVYALGIVLYETLTGRSPYRAAGFLELIHLIAAGDAPPIGDLVPDISVELQDVVRRAMHADIEKRIPSAAALASELAALRDQSRLTTTHLTNPKAAAERISGLDLGHGPTVPTLRARVKISRSFERRASSVIRGST